MDKIFSMTDRERALRLFDLTEKQMYTQLDDDETLEFAILRKWLNDTKVKQYATSRLG